MLEWTNVLSFKKVLRAIFSNDDVVLIRKNLKKKNIINNSDNIIMSINSVAINTATGEFNNPSHGCYEEFLADSAECPTCRGLGRIKRGKSTTTVVEDYLL